MSLFFRSVEAERRSIDWADVWGAGGYDAFIPTDLEAEWALRIVPVYAAVSLIADQLATLPARTYRGQGVDRQQIPNAGFMSDFNESFTWVDWVHQLMASLLLRGNAYGVCYRSGPYVSRVEWLNPQRVFVDESKTYPVYTIAGGQELTDYAHGGQIIHVRAFVRPGWFRALSPIGLFREQFEFQHQAVRYGKDWFEGGGVPTGTLQNTQATMDAKDVRRAKSLFLEQMKRPGPVALDKNWTYTKVGLTAEEAQFLQTIKAGATQIAAIYRVAPEDIGGESGKSMTYKTLEQDQQRFNIRTLLPWAVRIESALNQLLPRPQYMKFDMDGLARPTFAERLSSNETALRSGQKTLQEVRAEDNRPMLTTDEIAFWQQNFATTKSQSSSETENEPAGGDADDEEI